MPQAKTVCRVSVYAATTAVCWASGRACTASGVVTASGLTPVWASTSAREGASRLAYTVPKTAVPNALPIVRKKVTPEVATPRSR